VTDPAPRDDRPAEAGPIAPGRGRGDIDRDQAEVLEGEIEEVVERAVKEAVVSYSWMAPLPPPRVLAGYNDVVPGSAERIIALTESQVRHRQELERDMVLSGNKIERRGQVIGASLAVLALVLGFVLILLDHSGYGFAVIVTAAVGFLGAAALDRVRQKRALQEGEAEDRELLDVGPDGQRARPDSTDEAAER
jgi:uncharacterized membrane protein